MDVQEKNKLINWVIRPSGNLELRVTTRLPETSIPSVQGENGDDGVNKPQRSLPDFCAVLYAPQDASPSCPDACRRDESGGTRLAQLSHVTGSWDFSMPKRRQMLHRAVFWS